jgi:hypothetical protein
MFMVGVAMAGINPSWVRLSNTAVRLSLKNRKYLENRKLFDLNFTRSKVLGGFSMVFQP